MLDFDVDLVDSDGNAVAVLAQTFVEFSNENGSQSAVYLKKVAGNGLGLQITIQRHSYDNCTPFCVVSLLQIQESLCSGKVN